MKRYGLKYGLKKRLKSPVSYNKCYIENCFEPRRQPPNHGERRGGEPKAYSLFYQIMDSHIENFFSKRVGKPS